MKPEPITLTVKEVSRLIQRGMVQTYAAIERGDMVAVPDSYPMRIPITEVERFRKNMPRRGPKPNGKSGGTKPKGKK